VNKTMHPYCIVGITGAQLHYIFAVKTLKTRGTQRAQTPPRLLDCFGEYGCIVTEKRRGAPC